IPQLDELTVQRFAFGAKAPRLTLGGIASRVGAHKGREHPELYPSGKELSIRLATESADIGTAERQARYRQPLQLQYAQAKVLPCSDVIAGPHRCISLRAGIGGPGNGEWPLFLEQLLQAIVGSTHHLHAVHVVG